MQDMKALKTKAAISIAFILMDEHTNHGLIQLPNIFNAQ